VFAFGLVAFGFLGMGPVTIAVDSYGPVTDNAQSVFELSTIEQIPNAASDIQKTYGFTVNFEKAKHFLEENDGAGNTFKATAKPVLIGTAVVGATTMIFLDHRRADQRPDAEHRQAVVAAPAVPARPRHGGAIIYWFTGASMQAVTTGAYRAVEFIKANMDLTRQPPPRRCRTRRRSSRSARSTRRAGMFNIFLTVFFATLAFAFAEPFFFIGYLISIALFGLYQRSSWRTPAARGTTRRRSSRWS
jgi:K(+)-stimulated pyrophosphate-energized sodium pump